MLRTTSPLRNRRGAALILTLMITVAIAAMAMGAIMLSSGAQLTTGYTARQAAFQAAADGGLGIIRDSVNRGVFDTLLPANSYRTLASNQPVTNALGQTLPRVTRSLYIGRTGGRTGGSATAGQYGSNFASALSVISDDRGAVAARRLLLTQESWAKFAVAINNWNGSAYYGLNEEIHGPFHSNAGLNLAGGCTLGVNGTLFTGSATVVGSISNQSCGRFQRGVKTGAAPIPWPTPAKVTLMRQYAQDADAANGDYDITSPNGTTGTKNPALRIEFLTIDVNNNGTIEWDEGFMRVWKARNTSDTALAFATGRRWPYDQAHAGASNSDPNMMSRTCGAVYKVLTTDPSDSLRFHTAQQIYTRTFAANSNVSKSQDSVRKALSSGTRRCYLGGDPHIWSKATGDTLTPDSATITMTAPSGNLGWWVKRRSGAFSAIATKRSGDASYLIPLGGNANFKGVIYVSGDVAISGRLAGRVSVFSTGNIIMADDLLYTNAPGTKCDATGDIFGAIASGDVVIENNNLQTPFKVNNNNFGGFDDSNDANYNMFFLAVGNGSSTGNWYGEQVFYSVDANPTSSYFGGGSNDASYNSQQCGTAINGCVRVTGGLGQGRVDGATYWGSGQFGWAEAHSYDPCGAVNPPPYFPTTGRFIESRYYELDPVWLRAIGIDAYFTKLRAQ